MSELKDKKIEKKLKLVDDIQKQKQKEENRSSRKEIQSETQEGY